MAKLVYALNVSLDGYVDHMKFAPDPVLFNHFIEDVCGLAGMVYGRRMYELMRYWDEEQPGWSDAEREYAVAWRSRPKWVVSRTLEHVGPNATLIAGNLEAAVAELKTAVEGTIEVAGTEIAAHLGDVGLIDEYQLYVHPVVLGGGTPFFLRARPRLRLADFVRIGEDVIRLTYLPA